MNSERIEPTLRHEFVGMMFALTIGEVGLQAAALVKAGIIKPLTLRKLIKAIHDQQDKKVKN